MTTTTTMKNIPLLQFTADSTSAQTPAICFAYPGIQLVDEPEGNHLKDVFQNGVRSCRLAAQKVRASYPPAFEKYTRAYDEMKEAEKALEAARKAVTEGPTEVDAYEKEMTGEADNADSILADIASTKKAADKAEAAVKVKTAYFERLCKNPSEISKVNASLEEEADRRAKKTQASAQEVVEKAQALLESIEAFTDHDTHKLTTKVASILPYDGSAAFNRLKDNVKKEMKSAEKVPERYAT